MATYGEVRTKFIARMRRGDMTTALADGFLDDAIQRIQRVLRVPGMEVIETVTLTAGTYFDAGAMDIPADYLELISMTVWGDTDCKLERRDLGYVISLNSDNDGYAGVPEYYARNGTAWVLAPPPASGTVVHINYFADFGEFADDNASTVLSITASDLMLYGALSYACDHYNDKRGPRFEERFVQIVSDIQEQAARDELSGGAVVAPAFYYPNEDEVSA